MRMDGAAEQADVDVGAALVSVDLADVAPEAHERAPRGRLRGICLDLEGNDAVLTRRLSLVAAEAVISGNSMPDKKICRPAFTLRRTASHRPLV